MLKMHALFIHMRHPAQRWYMFQNMGPSPSGRSGHAMASNGTRILVLGGESSGGAQADEAALIHVLDTSTYFPFVILLDGLKVCKTQSTSSTPNPTPTLSSLARRPPNSRASHPRDPKPRSNHHVPLQQLGVRQPHLLRLLTLRNCAAR